MEIIENLIADDGTLTIRITETDVSLLIEGAERYQSHDDGTDSEIPHAVLMAMELAEAIGGTTNFNYPKAVYERAAKDGVPTYMARDRINRETRLPNLQPFKGERFCMDAYGDYCKDYKGEYNRSFTGDCPHFFKEHYARLIDPIYAGWRGEIDEAKVAAGFADERPVLIHHDDPSAPLREAAEQLRSPTRADVVNLIRDAYEAGKREGARSGEALMKEQAAYERGLREGARSNYRTTTCDLCMVPITHDDEWEDLVTTRCGEYCAGCWNDGLYRG